MKRSAVSLILILLLAAGTALGVYVIRAVERPRQEKPTPLPVPVELLRIKPRDFTHRMEALGTIRPLREALVGAEVTGPVVEIPPGINLGRVVDKGTLLAQIDPTPFRIEVKYRQALVARARAQLRAKEVETARMKALLPINQEKLRLAKAEVQRLADLLAKEMVAPQEVERKEMALRRIQEEFEQVRSGLREVEVEQMMAEAELASARAELARARKALADTRVRAPFRGIISEKRVTLGEQVERGRVLFHIADISVVKLLLRVPADEINFLHTGTPAQISVRGFPSTFQGQVEHIGPQADDETRSFPVEVLIRNHGPRRLLPGMFARARIPIHTYPNAILVPRSSVLTDSGIPTVFVADIEQGIAHRHPVTLGRTFGSRYLVQRGLQPGDPLVVTGQNLLRDGANIRVVGTKVPEP